jgi:hypothetical protein
MFNQKLNSDFTFSKFLELFTFITPTDWFAYFVYKDKGNILTYSILCILSPPLVCGDLLQVIRELSFLSALLWSIQHCELNDIFGTYKLFQCLKMTA